MVALDSNLRGTLEKAVVQARDVAEAAASASLGALAVNESDAFASMDEAQRRLRNALRARDRQLGDGIQGNGLQPLVEEVAYEQWHRMLFARFLAENNLLIHPEGAPITLDECEELAQEEGEPDRWQVAAKYASRMLPGIFRSDDPSAQVRFAPEGRAALERILAGLASAVFTADDGLGWVYQFWQSKKKKEVNASGRKIGSADLAPVTQLFTEDYMVRFLLQNSLGAWWALRHPDSPLLKEFAYLRLKEDGTPAAGTFEGWPERAAEVTIMDPCCGSGHFLVVAFQMLWGMRHEEEQLPELDAADAVLRDNLFGLEIDQRCVQIAAFALGLAAWRVGGYRPLPSLNLACSGIPVTGLQAEWTKLAGDDQNLRYTLERLYELFKQAPIPGSLIDPSNVPVRDRMFAPDFARVAPVLDRALVNERAADPVAAVFGQAAAGVARAADLLSRKYTLVPTNVPYLARGKQSDELKLHLERQHAAAKSDLATAFVERCGEFAAQSGAYALVTPQNWLLLGSYSKLRGRLLKQQAFSTIANLGPKAFSAVSTWDFNVSLIILTCNVPDRGHTIAALDVSAAHTAREKSESLIEGQPIFALQTDQLRNPDARVALQTARIDTLLASYAHGVHGLGTKDAPRFIRRFWEPPTGSGNWKLVQSTVEATVFWGGMEFAVFWEDGSGALHELGKRGWAVLAGGMAWGRPGVCISQMGQLPASLYTKEIFDKNVAVILPKDPKHLPAIWAFASSPEFNQAVRRIDTALKVTNASLVKVPFYLERWQKVADEQYPNGLPEPYSNDPTQWLCKGDPTDSTEPLQVAVDRMLGYHWPQQERDSLSPLADEDGVVALAAVGGEEPAAERLRKLLATAYGTEWSPAMQEQLLQRVGYGGKTLDRWLRDGFFEQHTKLFQQRPFIWHIWDGRKDGFSALVNYHSLDGPKLDRLIYTYLGAWIAAQQAERDSGTAGADGRLVAALQLQDKLKLIRAGEPPYDIYVRWKPLEKQPIGWDPDVNDGVRLNIRPFVTAGVLRSRVNVNWNKDRGTNPDGSPRLNDLHFTTAQKWAARKSAGV